MQCNNAARGIPHAEKLQLCIYAPAVEKISLSLSRPFSPSVFVSLLSSGEERERGNSLWGIMQSRVRVCFVPCGTSGNDRKRKRERERERNAGVRSRAVGDDDCACTVVVE